MALKSIKKMSLVSESATLAMSVAKEGGPLSTALEVGSTAADDASHTDEQLTPGPATQRLDPNNSYALVWTVAFTRKGTATLTATVTTDSGRIDKVRTKKVEGVAGDVVSRVVLIP